MKEQLHRLLEIDARTWQVADERGAAKILLAYRRFASEEDVTPAVAALLTSAWCKWVEGAERDAFDRRPAR